MITSHATKFYFLELRTYCVLKKTVIKKWWGCKIHLPEYADEKLSITIGEHEHWGHFLWNLWTIGLVFRKQSAEVVSNCSHNCSDVRRDAVMTSSRHEDYRWWRTVSTGIKKRDNRSRIARVTVENRVARFNGSSGDGCGSEVGVPGVRVLTQSRSLSFKGETGPICLIWIFV